MDFDLSEEQELLRAGLRELLVRTCDLRRMRAVAYDGDGRDPDTWRALAAAGWTGVTVPRTDGGAGLRFEELMLVAAEAGRALLHLPLTTTLLAARLLAWAAAGRSGPLLARIAAGDVSLTLALRGSPEDWNGARPLCHAERTDDGWRLRGAHTIVPFGPLADRALVEAALPGGGRGIFAVPCDAAGVSWAARDMLDRSVRQFDLALDGVSLDGDASLFGDADAGTEIEALLDEWRAVLAAETFGAAERMVEISAAYAKDRVQFGRPIGANQAVKTRIAEMAAAVERMRAAVYHAAVKIDADAPDGALAVAMAKVVTAAPGAFVGTQAIHVHGGIGFTWEHDIHLYFRRCKSNELLLGDGAASLARIADSVLTPAPVTGAEPVAAGARG